MNAAAETPTRLNRPGSRASAEERYFAASQWQLVWWKFRKHRLGTVSLVLLVLLYLVALTYEFWAPYNMQTQDMEYVQCPPTRIRFVDSEGKFRGPFIYGITQQLNEQTFRYIYDEDTSQVYPIRFFWRGEPYRFWGLFGGNLRFFGVSEGRVFLFGTDMLGRDLFSRVLGGARISLSVGLLGVFISFVLGCTLGSISGYLGGWVDVVIQRIIEFLLTIPRTPLWMALSAAVPPRWPPVRVYFAITVILSLIGWTSLARVVRGKLLELRESDFVMAARIAGAGDARIISRHLLPGFASYLIVSLTLAIPGMILGETALSFLGLGIRPPAVSWGTLLQDAQNVRSIATQPWMLIPGLCVIVTVLLYNFVGDGLRDAADPYK